MKLLAQNMVTDATISYEYRRNIIVYNSYDSKNEARQI